MKEKKLTDEEIVKGLEWCCYKASKQGCVGCAYCETVNDDIRCRMKKMLFDTLDLIHRLQDENERLTSLYDGQSAYMTSGIGDLPLTVEGLRKAVDEICKELSEGKV